MRQELAHGGGRMTGAGPRIIYLAGHGRSGSTLVARLLGEVRGACALGEVVHLWRRSLVEDERCGCGVAFSACDFWRRVGEVGFGSWKAVDPRHLARLRARVDRNRFLPLLAGPALPSGFERALEEYAWYYRRLYTAVAEVSGCDTIIDSSKHPSLAFCLHRASGLDVRVIHVVRDSRAVAYAWTREVVRPDSLGETYMRTLRPLDSAAQWCGQNAVMHLGGSAAAPLLRVRYEDVVRAPGAALRTMTGFAGLPGDDEALAFLLHDGSGVAAELSPAHTVSGNRLRFASGRTPIRADDLWRDSFPAAQRRVVTAVTFPLLAAYGYLGFTGPALGDAATGSRGPG